MLPRSGGEFVAVFAEKHMVQRWFLACLAAWSCGAAAAQWEEHTGIAALFSDAGVRGTFVAYDVKADRLIGHDEARAKVRYVPASTFKIANALIGLTRGAVRDVDEVLPYGGKPQRFPAWEKDLSLREGFPVSSVPVYQELARRIGLEAMRNEVVRLEYGNAEIGSVIDRFWLDGPLQISALEQTRFLARLAKVQLPASPAAQRSVREIARIEQGPGWALYGKTGWSDPGGVGIGWWVGWIRKHDDVYAFALNMDMQSIADAPKRIEIGRAALQQLGMLPSVSAQAVAP